MASSAHERETSSSSWDHEEDAEMTLDTASDIAKVLRVKRWEVQKEPFRGFNSPPGRF